MFRIAQLLCIFRYLKSLPVLGWCGGKFPENVFIWHRMTPLIMCSKDRFSKSTNILDTQSTENGIRQEHSHLKQQLVAVKPQKHALYQSSNTQQSKVNCTLGGSDSLLIQMCGQVGHPSVAVHCLDHSS